MQTSPIAVTSPGGRAQPPAAAAGATEKPGAGGVAGIFAGLVQALTGDVQPEVVPATGGESGGTAVEGDAPAAGEAQSSEGEGKGEGEGQGEGAVAVLVPQLQDLQKPFAAAANPASGGAAVSAASDLSQAPGRAPEAAFPPPPAQPAASAQPATAGADAEMVTPPSAQAAELAKVLGAGTQVHVTREAADAAPVGQTVQGLAGIAVAAALAEAPVAAAAEPLFRRVTVEPQKASPLAAAFPAPSDGDATKTASAALVAAAPEKPTSGSHKDSAAARAGAPAAADALQATSGAPTLVGAPAPEVASSGGEASAPLTDAAASPAREGQASTSQAPGPSIANTAQPAAPTPERAQAPATPAAPTAAGQVFVHIAKAVRAGVDRIDIQLTPASLGRVEISLDLSDTQHVRASISVETSEALDLLRADARGLERALQDAGLKTEQGSLSFQLRDHGARAGHDSGSRQGYAPQQQSRADIEDSDAGRLAESVARAGAPVGATSAGRIDIHA